MSLPRFKDTLNFELAEYLIEPALPMILAERYWFMSPRRCKNCGELITHKYHPQRQYMTRMCKCKCVILYPQSNRRNNEMLEITCYSHDFFREKYYRKGDKQK